jgi:hypothetical protein
MVRLVSRLARLGTVELGGVRARLTGSFRRTSEVTSHSTQVLAVIRPEEAVTGPTEGMLR